MFAPGGVSAPGGCLLWGGCLLQGGVSALGGLPQCMLGYHTPPVNRMTDACENITLP